MKLYHICITVYGRGNFLQKDTEPENAQYAHPKRVLDYVWYSTTEDIVGKIRENAYPITLARCCDVLNILKNK